MKLTVDHLRDLGVVELGFGNASRRPMINLQQYIVGEGLDFRLCLLGLLGQFFKSAPNGLSEPGKTSLSPKRIFTTIVLRLPDQWFSQEFFWGGAKFRARGFAACLFVFARFARKKVRTSGTSP